jgi:hypothetical protein
MQNATLFTSRWADLVSKVSGVIDLDSSALATRALVRRREIRSGEMLLRLALAYGPGGLSLRGAAAWAGLSGLAEMSDTAVMKRVRNASEWLGQVAGALLHRRGAARTAAAFLPDRQLRITDGSVITQPGSRGTDWRLHASYDPVSSRFTDLDLTDAHGAESLTRAGLKPGDVALGDRNYAKPAALKSVLDQGADFVVRVGWSSLRLLQADGTPLVWETLFGGLQPGGAIEQRVQVAYSGNPGKRGQIWFEARLIVRRASVEAAEQGRRRVRRGHSKRRSHAELQPITVQSAGFLMLLTSLPAAVSLDEVLAAYRVRWQVELAFKRLKSQLGLDRLPAKSRTLARSWLLAHLILALLIDDLTQEVLDSPPYAASNAPTFRLTLADRPPPA